MKPKSILPWEPEFSVNIHEIDKGNKEILNIVNDLGASVRSGDDIGAIKSALESLIVHFRRLALYEERLMGSKGFPDYALHKNEHDLLIGVILNVHKNLKQDESAINEQSVQLIAEWIANHILGSDKKFASFVNGGKAEASPGGQDERRAVPERWFSLGNRPRR